MAGEKLLYNGSNKVMKKKNRSLVVGFDKYLFELSGLKH